MALSRYLAPVNQQCLPNQIYDQMSKEHPKDDLLKLYRGICLFYLGRYAEANKLALEGTAART